MGMIFKLKAQLQQFILVGFCGWFPFGEKAFQYAPVFAQGIIYVSYVIVGCTFKVVIVCCPAIIITKFFIASAFYGLFAKQAGFGFFFL